MTPTWALSKTDWLLGAALAGAFWGMLLGAMRHWDRARRANEQAELRRAAQRAAGEARHQ